MIRYLFFIGAILTLFGSSSCDNTKNDKASTVPGETLAADKNNTQKDTLATDNTKNIKGFLPKGFIIFEQVFGDVNKDGLEDFIIIIKGTDKNKIVKDEVRGELDRNRRGIIVLLDKNNKYELAVKNYNCFSSENEEGGVYYPPELSVETGKGNLYINYAHGRYGYWRYTFRFQNSDFELIGYDASSSRGPVIDKETSINYLTQKKIVKENTNENAESGEEVFEETVTKISKNKLRRLSEIKDFDELEVSED
jgi:hypothetical protein